MKELLLTTGVNISNYRILQKLGAGEMGEVYLAEDSELDRRVAINFMPPATAGDEKARSRLVRDPPLGSITPNILTIYLR